MTLRRIPLALGLCLLALGACGDDSDGGSGGNPISLVGRSFVATTADGFALPDAATLVIRFDAGQLGVSGGCNLIGGAYRFDGAVLIADEGFMQTEMACDEPLMQLDADVVALLGSKPTISMNASGETITITGAEASLALTEQQPPVDLPLEGTVWTVTTIIEGEAASGGFAVSPTLTFHDGTVDVFAGCNNGSATAVISETAIEFGPLALTRMACADDAMTVEAAVSAVFGSSVDYRIEGASLEIIGANGGLVLTGPAA